MVAVIDDFLVDRAGSARVFKAMRSWRWDVTLGEVMTAVHRRKTLRAQAISIACSYVMGNGCSSTKAADETHRLTGIRLSPDTVLYHVKKLKQG